MRLSQRAETLLKSQNLTEKQYAAAAERDLDLAVTAGAGSGKTRTLVARYLGLLADGFSPQSLVAITFTEKAALEMRSRVRSALRKLILAANNDQDRTFWSGIEQSIDSARIGTIHSLCTEIIRSHPAEARLDPQFAVIDEGLARIARVSAVENVLAQALEDADLIEVFRLFSTNTLNTMLRNMLEKRLDIQDSFNHQKDSTEILHSMLNNFWMESQAQALVSDLRQMAADGSLAAETTPLGESQVLAFLQEWQSIAEKLNHHDLFASVVAMQDLRNNTLGRIGGKKNSLSNQALTTFRNLMDDMIFSWLGRKEAVNPEVEQSLERAVPLLRTLFERAVRVYMTTLRNQQAVDFDDLEIGALNLLQQEKIAQYWKNRIHSVLVDEFQDTNQRQRQIVEYLVGSQPGRLFIVGDARQSIYRFRGADVTVFKEVKENIELRDGEAINLELTFRTHKPLLDGMGDILSAIMGTQEDVRAAHKIPFSPMTPFRDEPGEGFNAPHIEMIMGIGEDAGSGREMAANLLAQRLLTLKASGEIHAWQDVVLLFRASTVFPIYETALEAAGIPYVTVAGSGFYDRAEIRDLLNILRALSNPWDDLAMAGLLRSPAVGMSDLGVTQLRWINGPDSPVPFRQALQAERSGLSLSDQRAAERAERLLSALSPFVGRLSVAEILHSLVDITRYRAILATSPERTWRNVDKLLQDAYASGLYSVPVYLEYLDQIRAVGAREGEAVSEAEQAVQLMTIHKAKGLEFPVVVLADAGRRKNHQSANPLQLPENGLTFWSDVESYSPLNYRLAKKIDDDQEAAEENRLLYVALTRVQEKLLISGYLASKSDKLYTDGWLKEMISVCEIVPETLVTQGMQAEITLPGGESLFVLFATELAGFERTAAQQKAEEAFPPVGDLWRPLPLPELEIEKKKAPLLITPTEKTPSQKQVGKLLHRVLQLWQFPESAEEAEFLEKAALEMGIFSPAQRKAAIERVLAYLHRLHKHALFQVINHAKQRHHEVPYSLADLPDQDVGRLDILYQTDAGWFIVDFKTDHLEDWSDLSQGKRAMYRRQLERYHHAVSQQLNLEPHTSICFLDFAGEIREVPLDQL